MRTYTGFQHGYIICIKCMHQPTALALPIAVHVVNAAARRFYAEVHPGKARAFAVLRALSKKKGCEFNVRDF